MRKIAVFTTTRADFGIFSALIREIEKSRDLDYLLFAGGSHVTPGSGKTIREIEDFNFKVTATFDYLLNEDSSASLSRAMGIAIFELADIFQNYEFDFTCVLGDRIELLQVVIASILYKKPIIHIHGGEKSEGVIDEQVRHMITRAAHIHFAACKTYASNIRKMGEPGWRIHNTGALAVDNINYYEKIQKQGLFQDLGLTMNKPTVLLTYHPVTLEFNISPVEQIKNIFSALENYDFQVVITSPNVELEREQIVSIIKEKAAGKENYHYFHSLGVIRYYSLVRNCLLVIGNSSSGIIEIPFFKIPTVNVGDRQKGRIRHASIIDTDYSVQSIVDGIEKALSPDFTGSLKDMEYRFGDGTAAKKMVEVIENVTVDERFIRKELDFSGL
jgi:UDP-hydrolysing UDP-N-acetyl-D-glucosamine 2-epimerase